MSVWRRSWVAFSWLVVTATVGVIWARVGKTLVNLGTGNGPFTGPFSSLIKKFPMLIPTLLSLIVVAAAVYVIFGGVTKERSVEKRRPPPR